jgi:hypothetical protein
MAFVTQTIGTTFTSSKINVALWLTQGALALLFLFAGSGKLVMSGEEMTAQMDFGLPIWFLRFIGVCEVAGALGLILPSVSRVRTGLTALAACGLVVIMAGATTLCAMEGPVSGASFPLFAGIAAAFVAYGRTHVAPLSR